MEANIVEVYWVLDRKILACVNISMQKGKQITKMSNNNEIYEQD